MLLRAKNGNCLPAHGYITAKQLTDVQTGKYFRQQLPQHAGLSVGLKPVQT